MIVVHVSTYEYRSVAEVCRTGIGVELQLYRPQLTTLDGNAFCLLHGFPKSVKALTTFQHHHDNQTSTFIFHQKVILLPSISIRRVLANTLEAALGR